MGKAMEIPSGILCIATANAVENPICAQELLMRLAIERAQEVAQQPAEPEPFLRRLWQRLRGKSS